MIRMGMRCTAVTIFKKGKERKEEEENGGRRERKEGREEGKRKEKENAHDRLLTVTIDNINLLKKGR